MNYVVDHSEALIKEAESCNKARAKAILPVQTWKSPEQAANLSGLSVNGWRKLVDWGE
ncbi:hypothetical protein RugamoR64_38690 [Duganella rhizosphaerae]